MALTDQLVSVWELSEASGNALDSFGSNTLTETSGTIDASGTKPSALAGSRDFELGDTEYFAVADNASLSTGDVDFTFSAWYYLESAPTGSDARVIFAKSNDNNAGAANQEYSLYVFGDGHLYWDVSSGSAVGEVDGGTRNSLSTWFFVVCWHDSVNNQVGVSVNAGAASTASYSAGGSNSTFPFEIGRGIGSALGGGRAMDGLITQVAMWKRVLTSQERTDLYAAGAGLPYSLWAGGGAPFVWFPLGGPSYYTEQFEEAVGRGF